jgi:hypothetical protein
MNDEDGLEEIPMREGWPVRALAESSNVHVGDVGEIRRTALSAYHLVYWTRQKATSFVAATSLERIRE